jgi:glyceraldehyde 3-phosphate dehydrogenase
MSTKVGINGFGRIGRLAFRRCVEEGLEVVAINDLSSPANLAYLLKYDTAHGTWRPEDISFYETGIIFCGKKVPVYAMKDPAQIPWKNHDVEVVLECTGRFKDQLTAGVHIANGGAKGVIISAPASDKVTPTYSFGVNTDKLTADQKVISGASCTTNCLAPVCKVLDENFGIVGGYMTTVHAFTNDQASLDIVKEKDFRRGRTASQNIVPSSTGAAKAIGLVLPQLKGRLQGSALRVPVMDGSMIDLHVILKKKTTKEEINAAMKKASEGELKGILGYSEDQIVSSDIIGITYGGLYDAVDTNVFDDPDGNEHVDIFAWYDNEYSYTCQLIRLAKLYGEVLGVAD